MVPSTPDARLVGYARVSTGSQDLGLQLDALEKYGVERKLIFTDKASGASHDRAGLDACFKQRRSGEVLLVWRLDRLGRSVRHLVTLIDQLKELGVGFRSVCDGAIDTTTPSGELIFHVFSALAQFERRLIQERTKAGIAAARAHGRKGGRPPMNGNEPNVVLAKNLYRDKTISLDDICATLKMSTSTLYRCIAMRSDEEGDGQPSHRRCRGELAHPLGCELLGHPGSLHRGRCDEVGGDPVRCQHLLLGLASVLSRSRRLLVRVDVAPIGKGTLK